MPVFSIVIPCYNSWRFMERGICSLEQQTFSDFEVIFVDDCSTDDTYSQLVQYQHKSNLNISVLRNEKNKGPGKSRNHAINIAKGEYLAFMDSDDWYEDCFLEQIYTQIQTVNAEIIFCDFYRCFNSGDKVKIKINSPLAKCLEKEYIALAFTSLCCLSVKKSIAIENPIPDIYHGEDTAIIPVWIAKAARKGCIASPLYNYFYRQHSLSTSINQHLFKSILDDFLFLKNKIDENYKTEVEFRGICMLLYAGVFKAIESNTSILEIKKMISPFIKLYPNWSTNIYLHYLPWRKRFFLWLVRYKKWSFIKLYVIGQKKILAMK